MSAGRLPGADRNSEEEELGLRPGLDVDVVHIAEEELSAALFEREVELPTDAEGPIACADERGRYSGAAIVLYLIQRVADRSDGDEPAEGLSQAALHLDGLAAGDVDSD